MNFVNLGPFRFQLTPGKLTLLSENLGKRKQRISLALEVVWVLVEIYREEEVFFLGTRDFHK